MSLKNSTTTSPKLNDYSPESINVKISMGAMVKRLKALEALADDPGQVKKWINRTWQEAMKCEIVG
jgi:hypothetical protein